MATVTLGTLWLNLAADPSVPLMSALQVTTSRKGEVRRYTTGRLRSVVQVGKAQSVSATLPSCTREQLDWLAQQQGELLCVRDDRGRKLWATYYEVAVDEHRHNKEGNVSLTLNEVTHSEVI